MKKFSFVTVLTAFLVLTSFGGQAVFAKSDITGHVFEQEMRSLEALNIMNGDGKGNFFPDRLVTRAQFAAFLNRSLNLPNSNDKTFLDTVNHPLGKEVHNAASAGFINGVGDGRFLPDRTLTREEVALMVSRVLSAYGLSGNKTTIPTFKDHSEIKYPNALKPIFAYKIMNGYPDQTFRPKEGVTRAQTAAVIFKMYTLLQKQDEEKNNGGNQGSEDNKNDNGTSSDHEDKTDPKEDQSSEKGKDTNQIDPRKEHLAISTKLINIYEDGMKRVRTYVNVGTEMKFLELLGNRVAVEVAGVVGYVNPDDVKIVPKDEVENRTYYKVVNGYLRHYVIQNGQYESYIYGPAPRFLKEGEKDYSFDGRNFEGGTYFQYFNYLPLLSETRYTAEELDEYVRSQRPNSPLIGLGKVFKQAEKETGVNALYLLAHAIHESAWGTSKIAMEKNNLYGIRAIDADPYANAYEFPSLEDNILYAAKYVKQNYLIPGAKSYYFGSFLGHKGVGVNLFYASDPYWGQKIAGRMYLIDEYLGQKDLNHYDLVMTKVPSLNVRSGPSTNANLLYEHRYAGVTMILLDEVKRSDGIWYKVKSDHPDYKDGYIYAKGERGNYAEIIK
ncbi:S-layer homology domain-containing protein [Calidifontibacillus erzurumensis]|uniref:S-layer homology domain-containing protein n=1 Tax=Calidifontibacillus erzurumensis TaxID=2741433 RepID=A0A8J8GJ16_9BACI|nr:S-layer homology domain-containing protein [Calidifontibacillus erzurumensis]NSL53253.1 S-layer homology domain-containing protein [Calidifontibacillus erzurumensis]